MQVIASSGAVLVAASGVLAITPAAPPLADVVIPAVRLTANDSFLDAIQAAELGFNEDLVNGELGFNHGLLGAEQLLLGAAADQDDVVNRLISAVLNMRVDFLEGTVNGLLGAHAEVTGATDETAGVSALTQSLILGDPDAVFNDGDIGGADGIRDQQDAALSLLIGQPTLQDLLATEASQLARATDFNNEFGSLSSQLIGPNGAENQLVDLLSGSFDAGVLDGVERLFNVGNMELETFLSTLFGLVGVNPLDVASYADGGVSQLTSSLILGDPDAVFNGGDIGGLEGVFDQSLAALLSFTEVNPADIGEAASVAVDPLSLF